MKEKQIHHLQSQAILVNYFYGEEGETQKVIAAHLNVPKQTMSNWVNGHCAMAPELFRKFTEVTRYQPAIDFLTPKGMRLVVADSISNRGTVCGECVDLTSAVGKFCGKYHESLNDGKLDAEGRKRLRRALMAIKEEVAQLEHAIEYGEEAAK